MCDGGGVFQIRSGQVRSGQIHHPAEKKTASGPRAPADPGMHETPGWPGPASASGLGALAELLNLKSLASRGRGPPPRPGQRPNLKEPQAAGAAGLNLKTKNQEPQRSQLPGTGAQSVRLEAPCGRSGGILRALCGPMPSREPELVRQIQVLARTVPDCGFAHGESPALPPRADILPAEQRYMLPGPFAQVCFWR